MVINFKISAAWFYKLKVSSFMSLVKQLLRYIIRCNFFLYKGFDFKHLLKFNIKSRKPYCSIFKFSRIFIKPNYVCSKTHKFPAICEFLYREILYKSVYSMAFISKKLIGKINSWVKLTSLSISINTLTLYWKSRLQ